MKRNMQMNRAVRHTSRGAGRSKYAEKVARGHMMYGPGCCAHTTRVRSASGRSDADSGEEALRALRFAEAQAA